MSGGFIRLSRKFFEGRFWTTERTFSYAEAWLDLVRLARFESEPFHKILARGRMLTIERGEIHASLRFLAARWGWSKDKVGRFLKNCEKLDDVRQQTRQGENVITLCNYDVYNPPNFHDETPIRTPTRHQRDTDKDTDETNNKKEKNIKKEKKYPPTPQGDGSFFENSEIDLLFREFLDFRERLKRGINTPKAVELLVKKLTPFDDVVKRQMIETSMMNGWKGLFERDKQFVGAAVENGVARPKPKTTSQARILNPEDYSEDF